MKKTATAFACSNIALCKYWGKRDTQLNLPINSSLSISLADKGARVTISLIENNTDQYYVNHTQISADNTHYARFKKFLDPFRKKNYAFKIEIDLNIPLAAGLASSAAIYAAIVKALNELFEWNYSIKQLSILARLGSGSASRSIETGFVEWHRGEMPDGSDSFAERLNTAWPELRVGLCILETQQKKISSRAGMQRTVETSILYQSWPQQAERDLVRLKSAISEKNFELLGATAENNALAMHATMLASQPALLYSTPETICLMHKIWDLREKGVSVYFTQDAGPNLKLLFLAKDAEQIETEFNNVEVIKPF